MALFKKLFGWIANRWVISIGALIILALLIWFLGPLIAIGSYAPLDGEVARLLAIIAVVFVWGLVNVLLALKAKKTNEKMIESLTAEAPEDPSAVASREEVEVLRERFRDALAHMKKAKLGGTSGRRYLYQLPWYLMIGPPGGGKTTALCNSGLKFPLQESIGRRAVSGIGGTRNCDWFFTEDAVLVDTAGRYTTQDSDATVDRSAWQGFLDLLRKHRSRRPIDGLIIALSVTDLTGGGASHADAVRKRVQEIYSQYKIRVPVYVVVTKCDLLAGFTEMFADLRQEESEQVWGTTFPLAQSQKPDTALAAFSHEFDALIERLSARLLPRLEAESDIERRGTILSFPQQMALLKEPLAAFLAGAFGETRYDTPALLRGVYFSSATQEGTPIDRVIGAVARTFGLERKVLPPFSQKGRSFFLTRLFREVVFRESELVMPFGFFETHRTWILRGYFGGALVLTALLIAAFVASFGRNQAYVADVDRLVDGFEKQRGTGQAGSGDIEKDLAYLSALRALPGGYDDRDKGTPILMGFGLYQGDKLGDAARAAYERGLYEIFMPYVVQRLEQQVRENMGRTEVLYEALKVYLMVTTPEVRDKEYVRLWVNADWERRYPGAQNAPFREAFDRHLQAVLDGKPRSFPEDAILVGEARRKLAQLSPAQRLYARIRTESAGRTQLSWSLEQRLPPTQVRFFRTPEKPSTRIIPGLFTPEGYRDIFLKRRAELIETAVSEAWVFGPEYRTPEGRRDREDLTHDIGDLYYEDYIKVWQELLNGLDVATSEDIRQQADVVRAAARPTSPIKAVLQAVAPQVQLSRSLMPKEAAAAAAAVTGLQQKLEGIKSLIGLEAQQAIAITDPAAQVDRYFEPLTRLVAGEPQAPTLVDDVLNGLTPLASCLSKVSLGPAAGRDPLDPGRAALNECRLAVAEIESAANDQPAPLNRWILSLTRTSFNMVFSQLGSEITNRIQDAWRSRVLSKCSPLINRYPISKNSPDVISISDFGKFFGPDGHLDKFFKEFIEPAANTATRPWRWTADVPIGISGGALSLFESASVIRDAFFATGEPTPVVPFEIEPVALDRKARQVTLEIGDQKVVFRHDVRRRTRVQWPTTGKTGARVVFIQTGAGDQTSAISETGDWAFFKLLDKSKVSESSSSDRFEITFAAGELSAVFLLYAQGVTNPFSLPELTQFRCPDRL